LENNVQEYISGSCHAVIEVFALLDVMQHLLVKGKAFTGPQASRRLRLQDFETVGTVR